MLTVTVDLPTPPFPEATASTRVVAGSWTPRTSAPPRSCVVSCGAFVRGHDAELERHGADAGQRGDVLLHLVFEARPERAADDRKGDRDGDGIAVDPHIPNHAQLGHGLAQLRVDHPAERLQDLLVRRHLGRA